MARSHRPSELDPGNAGVGSDDASPFFLPNIVLPVQIEIGRDGERAMMSLSKKIGMTAVLAAVAVVLSPFSFPVGPTKVYPAQHIVNGIGGVLLGPWYAVLVALIAGVVRNALGTGTIFAFPGGIPGALIVGLFYRCVRKKDYAALTEPIGAAIGAIISALLVAPVAFEYNVIKSTMSLQVFLIAFLASSIPGSILGFVVLYVIRRSKIMP